jgi:hypothetical protein
MKNKDSPKIFMWFLSNKVFLTKDNLAKRKWNGCQKYCFCDSTKTVNHLFIGCPFAKIIWRMVYLCYNIPHQRILLTCLVNA